MTKYYAEDFIKWALTHVKKSTIPSNSKLPISIDECGTEPWYYLYGSVRVKTTQDTLDRYYNNYYGPKKKMTRAQFDKITKSWDRNGYATDCEGLLDAFLTYACNERTDINAHMNFNSWCTEKGKISEINRDYVIGECVFIQSKSTGRMTHIGWICGFCANGEPLVVEARGIAYGVVVTKLAERNWSHRGLMTFKFNYKEPDETLLKIKFEKTSPLKKGDSYLAMQKALNAAGYLDESGKSLEEDGKWGAKSQQAFEALIASHAPILKRIATFTSENGEYTYSII